MNVDAQTSVKTTAQKDFAVNRLISLLRDYENHCDLPLNLDEFEIFTGIDNLEFDEWMNDLFDELGFEVGLDYTIVVERHPEDMDSLDPVSYLRPHSAKVIFDLLSDEQQQHVLKQIKAKKRKEIAFALEEVLSIYSWL